MMDELKRWKVIKTGETGWIFCAKSLGEAMYKVVELFGYEKYIGCNILEVDEDNNPIKGGDFALVPVMSWWENEAKESGITVEEAVKVMIKIKLGEGEG